MIGQLMERENTGWIVNSLNRPSQLEAHKEREVVLSVLKSVREEGRCPAKIHQGV